MTSLETQALSLIEQFQGQEKTLAEFLGNLLKDQLVEIYLGDSYETISLEQHSTSYPALLCGKILGAYKECLVFNAAHYSRANEITLGKIIFINERGIRFVNPINKSVSSKDMFFNHSDSASLKKFLSDK